MNRAIYILSVMALVLCTTAVTAGARQSQQETLNSLNNTLQTVVFSTQNPKNNFVERWNNSYQFAVRGDHFTISYRLENTFLKGEEVQDQYSETGTYSAPLAMLSHAEISPSSQLNQLTMECNERTECFTREYSGKYKQKGKTTARQDTRSMSMIGLILPENLIEPTMEMLQELLLHP